MEPETQARFVARARRETERLEALISDILFLSELEATQGLPSDERSDLRHAAVAAVESLDAAARDHGVAVEVDAPTPVWVPLTDRMTRTVVENLLENAVKYAGPGARASVRVRREGDRVTVEVADDGAGISERHLPHVFERFYRADPSRSKQLGGTGLGLSIVKHIAERFGGQVEATLARGLRDHRAGRAAGRGRAAGHGGAAGARDRGRGRPGSLDCRAAPSGAPPL